MTKLQEILRGWDARVELSRSAVAKFAKEEAQRLGVTFDVAYAELVVDALAHLAGGRVRPQGVRQPIRSCYASGWSACGSRRETDPSMRCIAV